MATEAIASFWHLAGDFHMPKLYQEMAQDVVTWFNPEQGWSLTAIGGAIIPPKYNKRGGGGLIFHLDAQSLPKTGGGFLGGPERTDFEAVFAPDIYHKNLFRREESYTAIAISKVGPIYPLEQAMQEVTSPYYLVGSPTDGTAAVSLISRYNSPVYKDKKGREYPGSLAVSVRVNDLADYVRTKIQCYSRVNQEIFEKFIMR